MTNPTAERDMTMENSASKIPFSPSEVSSVCLSDDSDRGEGDDNSVGRKALENEERLTLAAKESRAVGIWRVFVYVVVLAVAIGVSLSVYLVSKNDQQEDFETAFVAYAGIVTKSFFESVHKQFGAYESLSTTITSFAGKFCSQKLASHSHSCSFHPSSHCFAAC